jgi:hypothetical protein
MLFLVLLSRGVPGEGPDGYLSGESRVLGRSRSGSGGNLFVIFTSALRAVADSMKCPQVAGSGGRKHYDPSICG